MEPSEENICLKFIDYYYDVFNHAPEVLFRLYDHQSLFTHKTIDGTSKESCLVMGQALIRPIIQELHFYHSCAKLHRIKFLLTVDNLHVVQVIGELTDVNHGKYCFAQTFVLEICDDRTMWPIIRSDIFRYRDFELNDEENEILRSTDDNEFTFGDFDTVDDLEYAGEYDKIMKSVIPKKSKKLTGKMKEIARREAKIYKDMMSAIRTGDRKRFNRLIPGFDINYRDENGRTLLHEAVTRGNKNIVRYLFKKGADVLQVTNKGFTSLHVAALEGQTSVVSILLNEISRCTLRKLIDARNFTLGNTALHIAAEMDFFSIVKLLIDSGANVQVKNFIDEEPSDLTWSDRTTALFFLGKEIIGEKREIELHDDDMEMESWMNKWIEWMREDIEFEWFREFSEKSLMSLVSRRVRRVFTLHRGMEDKLEILLSRAKDIKTLVCTRIARLKRSLDKKPAINADETITSNKGKLLTSKPKREKTEYQLLSMNFRDGTYILNHGLEFVEAFRLYEQRLSERLYDANISVLEEILEELEFDKEHSFMEKDGRFVTLGQGTRYHQLLVSRNKNDTKLFIELVEKMIKDPIESFIKSVLASQVLEAVRRDDLSWIERNYVEVVSSQSPELIDSNGKSPLHLATQNGNEKMVKFLLKNGANVTFATVASKITALHIAAAKGDVNLVKLLLSRNKSNGFIDAKTEKGSTPLHAAAKNNHLSVVNFLLENGANFHVRSADKKLAVDLTTDVKIMELFKIVDELFVLAKAGDAEILTKLKRLKRDVLLVVGNARNNKGTLAQNATVQRYDSIGREITQLMKKAEKLKNRQETKKP